MLSAITVIVALGALACLSVAIIDLVTGDQRSAVWFALGFLVASGATYGLVVLKVEHFNTHDNPPPLISVVD